MGRVRSLARIATVLAICLLLVEGVGIGISVDPAGAVQVPSHALTGTGVPFPASTAVQAPLREPVALAVGIRRAGGATHAGAVAARRNDRPTGHLLVRIERETSLTARPGGGRVVGAMPAGSRFYDTPHTAWALEVSEDGRFARVPVPYAGRRATGWLRIRGLQTSSTRVSVVADLSRHRIVVRRGDRVLFRAPAATGAPSSPTPPGRYFVTDRVPFPDGGVLGTFAFGISGIQTRLPPGWSGGDQLAIHGTNAPSTIGRSTSAGCLRVSEQVLRRLEPLLRLGTPVIIRP